MPIIWWSNRLLWQDNSSPSRPQEFNPFLWREVTLNVENSDLMGLFVLQHLQCMSCFFSPPTFAIKWNPVWSATCSISFEDLSVLVSFFQLVGGISWVERINASHWRRGYRTLEYCHGAENRDCQKSEKSGLYCAKEKSLPVEALHPMFHISYSLWNCSLDAEQLVRKVVGMRWFPSLRDEAEKRKWIHLLTAMIIFMTEDD